MARLPADPPDIAYAIGRCFDNDRKPFSDFTGARRFNGAATGFSGHFHNTGVKQAWQWWQIYRIAWRRFHAITFPSDFVRHEAETIYPPLAKIAHTLRNPIAVLPPPTIEERRAVRAKLNLPPDAQVVGNAGWLIPRKRFDIFRQMARQVVREIGASNVVFVIAGGWAEEMALRDLSRQLGIEDNVRWVGWLKDMQRFYHSIDLLLFNSDWDAFPTTPLETMAHGIPVVASLENGGLKKIIQNREHGILLNRDNVDTLAAEVYAGGGSIFVHIRQASGFPASSIG